MLQYICMVNCAILTVVLCTVLGIKAGSPGCQHEYELSINLQESFTVSLWDYQTLYTHIHSVQQATHDGVFSDRCKCIIQATWQDLESYTREKSNNS